MNSVHRTTKFTLDYSTTEINVLGVTVTKVGYKFKIHLCCKPTDMHQYLHAESYHHNVYKASIAHGQVVIFSTKGNLSNRLQQVNSG